MIERLVVVDIETTGLSPTCDRIIEIGAVAVKGGRITDEFHSLIDPGRSIPWHAQKVHGITDEMLKGKPRPEKVLPRVHNFFGQSVLVAHNAPFDLGFLQREFSRLGLELGARSHCTLQLARKMLPRLPNHRLETVAKHLLGKELIEGRQMHRELDDARVTAQIWLMLNA